MPHIKYPKIHQLGKEENSGIFDYGNITIQEKIDGANLSIWIEGGQLHIGSRTQTIYDGQVRNEFGGAVDYVLHHEGIQKYMKDHPTDRLYGEWLVKHTVDYPAHLYKTFWLFDILIDCDEDRPNFMGQDQIRTVAEEYKISTPTVFYKGNAGNVTKEILNEYCGQTGTGGKYGEGIVIKNDTFTNKFGFPSYAKMTTVAFKEKNAEVFGNHHSGDIEGYIRDTYVTFERLQKLIHKVEQNEQRDIKIEDTSRMMGMMYYDMVTEDIREIITKKRKNCIIDFGRLNRMIYDRTKIMFHEFLKGEGMSVAFKSMHDDAKGDNPEVTAGELKVDTSEGTEVIQED